jgi:transcriptional regulator
MLLLSSFYTEAGSMSKSDLLQGTLDLLILRALLAGANHGLGISRRIEQLTHGEFLVKPGSLFPALHRLEERGWLKAAWGESENRRRAKFYTLTAAGKREVHTETASWQRIAMAIARAVESTS